MTFERSRRSSRERRPGRPQKSAESSTPTGSRGMNPEAFRAQLADLANGTRLSTVVEGHDGPTIYRPHLELDADPLPVVVQSGGDEGRPAVSAWATRRRPRKTVTDSDE